MDMSTFLVSSVHDMKNSICVMTAYLEAALTDLPADAPSRNMTYQAAYEAQRINHHLIQLLALYKINQDIYPLDPVEVELASFADEVVSRVAPLASARGISLSVHLDDNEHNWYFDYELLASLVTQALHNAVKYTRDRVQLSLLLIDEQLEIRIADNGEGFPAFMIDSERPTLHGIDSHSGSTGLGLHFAAKAAHLHRNRTRHGTTRLENGGALGGGMFVITLP